jgi:cephalosporin hydroxylase
MVDRSADCIEYDKVYTVLHNLREAGENTDFSANNRKYLKEHLLKVPNLKCIVEIGVENNPDKNLTSTATIITNKGDAAYFGVDILDRKHLDNEENKVYTIQTSSLNVDEVMNLVRSKGYEEIDFLFIDGWHSIDMCEAEWNAYTPFLSKNGIVGFHDTNHHPGPRWLLENIDSTVWKLTNFPSDETKDFGIGFAWRR